MKRGNFWYKFSLTFQALACILLGTAVTVFGLALLGYGPPYHVITWRENIAFLTLWVFVIFGCFFLDCAIPALFAMRKEDKAKRKKVG